MSWSGGTYRKGNYATNGWTGDASLGIGIEAGRHDTQDDDFAAGINNCLAKDGSNTPSANLPMGGFKHTGCQPAVADTDYTTLGDVKGGISTQSTSLTINNTRFSADANGPIIGLRKSRGATVGTNTIVQNGDTLGNIIFYGANGTGYDIGAAITSYCAAAPGSSADMPGNLIFYTTPDGSSSSAERLRITELGKVGIGQGNPSAQLEVQSVIASTSALIAYNTLSGLSQAALTVRKQDNNNTTSNVLANFTINGAGTGSGQINANGASACAFGSFSDQRLKENIVDLPSQWDAFKALRPVEFDYKDGSGHQIGFIAQEVQPIYPDVVGESSDGYLTLTDMNKNDSRMVRVIKELIERVEALEAK